MARRKSRLPLREGSKLPPLTEAERLSRRMSGHPLDDFPTTRRMSRWREVAPGESAAAAEPKPSSKRSAKRSVIPTTERTTIPTSGRSAQPPSERTLERPVPPPKTKPSKDAYVALDATHTASEAKIYGFLYRLSITKGQPTCRSSLMEMQSALGLSKNTIIKAIRGLKEKLSIDVLDSRPGSRVGSLYYVYSVKDILQRRKDAEIEIDELKRVVPKGSTKRMIERLIERAKTERSMVQKSNVQSNVPGGTNSSDDKALPNTATETKNLLLRNDDDTLVSSSKEDDEAKRQQIKMIYCDLTGNRWRKQDDKEFDSIQDIPVGHIILGICYSLDRASGQGVGSLKYCIPSIRDHYQAMRAFPQDALMEIAYAHMMKLKHARKQEKR